MVVTKILRDVRPGAIILLHESGVVENGQPVCVLALEAILERLNAEGYQCVVPQDHQLRSR